MHQESSIPHFSIIDFSIPSKLIWTIDLKPFSIYKLRGLRDLFMRDNKIDPNHMVSTTF